MDIKTMAEKIAEKLNIDRHNIYTIIPINKDLSEVLIRYKLEDNIKYGEVFIQDEEISHIRQYGFEEEIQ